ncbi:MAG: glycogen debranching enzyme N-terminal domain-containing protein [Bacteroidetes bacterium]|nr:glycogen debranching enzyme N-terminal domain-containing protein [Bacteroidota bacterium]
MSYINFDKIQLVNLEYSLSRELIRSNRAGSYASSTIINCNTRKYHGMLVTPQPLVDNENHVLLSSLDETVIQREAEFNLGIHKYPGGVYNPKGHKYVRDFVTEPIPKLTYNVGGVILTKEMIFTTNEDRMLIKYTLEDAHSPTKLRFRPFLAFRNIHKLSKQNIFVETKYEQVPNGIKIRMYQGYTDLFLQISKENEYTHVPEWYYNIEFQEEMERGYEYQEDLFVPGFFDCEIKKGESIWFSAGTKEIQPSGMKRAYNLELTRRIPRNNFENCLSNSAHQFIVKKGNKTEIIAGFPWFGRWGRDTFISLPGLTLVTGEFKTCKSVIDTMIADLKGPLFPNIGSGNNSAYNSVDASLWFFWVLQQYAEFTESRNTIWKEYGKKMKLILEGYREGTQFNILMKENGLIHAGEPGKALTWMDAVVHGKPVTPRLGFAVEINALWYNAVMFSLEVAELANDKAFIKKWKPVADLIPGSFLETFWSPSKRFLADHVNGEYKDWSERPNMIFATSLPYSPVDEDICKDILNTVKQELLTPRGLRTLSPKNPAYKGIYYGDQAQRDLAYHQGTVWPWLLGHFAEGYLKIYGKSGLPLIKSLYKGFEPVMTEHGIGTISEIYDGDPPHTARGAISQAWSVAELLRINWLIKKYEKTDKVTK